MVTFIKTIENNNHTIFTYGTGFRAVWHHPAALNMRTSRTGVTVWCEIPQGVTITPVFNTLRAAVRHLRKAPAAGAAYYVNSLPLMDWEGLATDTKRAYLKNLSRSELERAIARAALDDGTELTFRELAIVEAYGHRLDNFLTLPATETALSLWDWDAVAHCGPVVVAVKRLKLYIPPKDGELWGREVPYWRALVLNRKKGYGYILDAVPAPAGTLSSLQLLLPPHWWHVWTRHERTALRKALRTVLIDLR